MRKVLVQILGGEVYVQAVEDVEGVPAVRVGGVHIGQVRPISGQWHWADNRDRQGGPYTSQDKAIEGMLNLQGLVHATIHDTLSPMIGDLDA